MDAKLAPYGGIWVFMTFGIGIVFVIPIDIFDRLDFFDCQKSDYKKIIIELKPKVIHLATGYRPDGPDMRKFDPTQRLDRPIIINSI